MDGAVQVAQCGVKKPLTARSGQSAAMSGKSSDIRIIRVEPRFVRVQAREPLKFGAAVLEAATYCLVEAEVENRAGSTGVGHGAIVLSDFWAFPDPTVPHPVREKAMARAAELFCKRAANHRQYGHPIDIYLDLEDELPAVAKEASAQLGLRVALPRLAALVSASPVDAALHDAYGIANGISTYDGYGPDCMEHDMSRFLGRQFKGRHIPAYLRRRRPRHLDAFHLVGGLDALREADVRADASDDGLPNSLEAWTKRDGLHCLKIKLKGTDLQWDLDRIQQVHRVARAVHRRMGIRELHLSLDTNEQCESPGYVVEMLMKLKERDRLAYDCVRYIEQPTARDIRRNRHDMGRVAALKPVVIDESLTSLEDFELALELHWSGIALKTCKGHTWTLLFAALAQERRILLTFQDLSNPGISLVHSAGLAARLRGVNAIEANSCQYFPQANLAAARVHPGLFRRRGGRVCLESVRGPGLGLRWDEIGADMACGGVTGPLRPGSGLRFAFDRNP